MSDNNRNHSHDYDDRLARFTDELLEGKAGPAVETEDAELREMEETISRLQQAFADEKDPSPLLRSRLRATLTRAWREEGRDQAALSVWDRWLAWGRRLLPRHRRPAFALALAALALILVLAALPFLSGTGNLTATVGVGGSGGLPLTCGAVAGLFFLLLFFFHITRVRTSRRAHRRQSDLIHCPTNPGVIRSSRSN